MKEVTWLMEIDDDLAEGFLQHNQLTQKFGTHKYPVKSGEFRVWAMQGYANAQYNLGLMYDNGQGVVQDYAEAVRWFRKAAEQGDAKAQFNVGTPHNLLPPNARGHLTRPVHRRAPRRYRPSMTRAPAHLSLAASRHHMPRRALSDHAQAPPPSRRCAGTSARSLPRRGKGEATSPAPAGLFVCLPPRSHMPPDNSALCDQRHD